MERLEEHVIHASLNRHELTFGCDLLLLVVASAASVAIALGLGSWWGIGIGLGLWFVFVYGLQRMGKADPLMVRVYLRHWRYATFYPAKSGLYSRSPRLPASWRSRR